jgi:quercetin dioxygenase-like cupin family protein
MQPAKCGQKRHGFLACLAVSACGGLALGILGGQSIAEMPVPTEHKGIEIETIGVIGAASMEKQIGLAGYVLQLREITIEPGGQIAQHSHENRPGIVKVLSGTWLEGRASGETPYDSSSGGLLEDENTIHWFFNTGDKPATAIVCDIVPAN